MSLGGLIRDRQMGVGCSPGVPEESTVGGGGGLTFVQPNPVVSVQWDGRLEAGHNAKGPL